MPNLRELYSLASPPVVSEEGGSASRLTDSILGRSEGFAPSATPRPTQHQGLRLQRQAIGWSAAWLALLAFL